jgi:endonuclease/exonuclease/phosphatase (EEP) superfamily protein YafD
MTAAKLPENSMERQASAGPSPESQVQRPAPSKRVRLGTGPLWGVLTGVLAAASVAGFLGRLWWVLDLTSHFRAQYGAALVVLAVLLLRARSFQAGITAALFALVNLTQILPLYCVAAPPPTGGRTYRVVFLNVYRANPAPEKVLEFLRNTDPDVVVLAELTPELLQRLQPLQSAYPFARCQIQRPGQGMGVWSRLPWEEATSFGDVGAASLVGQLSLSGTRLTLIGVHATWPMGREPSQQRNAQFAQLARVVAAQEGPVMILGDLNCTSWSPHFQELVRAAGLTDSRQGFGLQPSWPAGLLPVGIAIDHCLISPGLSIRKRWIGPPVGSDHYPVVVEFAVVRSEPVENE